MNDVKNSSLFSWLLFDLANTVYAFVIPGLYFSVWLVTEQGWTDQALGFVTSGAMVIVAITGPWVGARSDGAQGKKPLLFITTLACIVSTFLLGTFNVNTSVILFIISLIGFNLGSVVYDALLISVSNEKNRGMISGLGVAFGYIGSLTGFGVATYLQNIGYSYVEIFRSVAILFLIFSFPAFIFIREKKVSTVKSNIKIFESLTIVIKSWKHSTKYPGLTRFLVGRFFYADAINTLIGGLLAVYLVEEAGLTPEDSQGILALAIVVSIIGGLVFGVAGDILGPRICTLISLVCWMISLTLAIIATEFDQTWLIYVTGVIGGFNIGGIFAVDRLFMTRLSPEKHLGEFYGLYSTVGRFATIVGPLLWGFIVNTLGLGRNPAMGSLIILLLISFFIIKGVPDHQKKYTRIMNFKIATKKYVFDNVVDFKGRASRWEFWGGSLGFSIGAFFSIVVVSFISENLAYGLLLPIIYLWEIIAGLSAQIRRLHDVGKSGWNYLWVLTGIGIFYIIFLNVQPSQQKENDWGSPPEHTITNNEI